MLGKGLESLIPKRREIAEKPLSKDAIVLPSQTDFPPSQKTQNNEKNFQNSTRKSSDADAIFLIEIENIKPNPFQPRKNFDEESLKELAASIREFGIIQPLIISKIEKETEMGTSVEYQLIAGERRLRAAEMLGWERVPAIIKKIEQKADQLEIAIVENLQRADLNPIETARSYSKLQDEFSLTQREIGTRLGKSRETIANTLRLLDLPTEIQDALNKGIINESQARLLLVINDPLQQQNLFNELLAENLSVRELRNRIRKNQSPNSQVHQSTKEVDIETKHLEEQLAELLSAPVKIQKTEQGGKVVITFYSPEEIRGIIEKLNPKS
ncbi:MAG: ParB/RepB/Spo0J family partition protein [Patescibacteria group bacterium]